MSRFNIFNQIHKALRALLYDTALQLQQSNFNNADEAEAILTKVSLVLDIFDKHAEHEDHSILPAIGKYEPSLVDAFEQEHEEDHALAENLRILLRTYQQAKQSSEKIETGDAVVRAFIAFMIFNLQHMAKEESVLNERLWRHYSDAEIQAINAEIVASVSPEDMSFTSAWMMRGLSNPEITNWLKNVQTHAPEKVFNNLFTIAERELPNKRFRQLLEDLTEGAMVA